MAQNALRVLAMAYKELEYEPTDEEMKEIEEDKVCHMEHIHEFLSKRKGDDELVFEEYQGEDKKGIIEITRAICDDNVQIIGSVDTIHNVSVVYARDGYYECACSVLKKGLDINKYAKNKDLLADYLKYSTCSQQADFDLAEEYYKRLLSIDKKRWNWRAFSFSIDYLLSFLDSFDSDDEQILNECLQLAKEYKEKLGSSENGDKAYHALANVYFKDGNAAEGQKILRLAVEALKKAPMCALQLSEILFDNGMFDEAGKHIRRCISMNIDVDSSINMGYPYILSALCRIMSVYEKIEDIDDVQEVMKLVFEI